jgi:ATP-dependent Clp protease ATP-binding subunit ClpA
MDYRRSIEGKTSLAGMFTKAEIEEVDTENAILILEAKVGPIEYTQSVFFTYDALEKTVTLAQRYLHDRYLPEKAITLLEEVAVDVRKRHGKNAFVQAEDVARIVSEKAHVQVMKVTESETEKLLNLESIMHRRMIGQDEAVSAVAAALRRARTELRDPKRPIANFLFLGPTGVGKTELAKTVAEAYFGDENAMIRIDMSEYQDQGSISRLIGAPPGYQGSGAGGQLTEAVRSRPFSLILLDELEKAHPDVLNIFLQVMDDGRLTDGNGRTIDFTNVILIATSNAGTALIQQRITEGKSTEVIREELISSELGHFFKPEFLNRFDRIIVFKPLTKDEVVEIVKLMLAKVGHQLADRGISFIASDEAVRELADIGYDPTFGARPLRRAIQERVDNALANFLLQGQLGRRDTAILEAGGVIRVERATEV